MQEQRYYYAIVAKDEFGNFICVGTLNTYEIKDESQYIHLDVYDESLVGHKMWTGSEWLDNPNYVEPVVEPVA